MNRQSSSGFSLLELMIGLTLGLIVLGGVVAMFLTSSATASNQQRIAQVLENGRFGAQILIDELRRTGTQYCSSYTEELPTSGGVNRVRPLIVHAMPKLPEEEWMHALDGDTSLPIATYLLDPAHFVRGYECAADGSCTPELPTEDVHTVPAIGSAEFSRVPGTDVLTIRYLATDGALVGGSASGSNPIPLKPGTSPGYFDNMDLALIASCRSAEVVRVKPNGLQLEHVGDDPYNFDATLGSSYAPPDDARVFNFSRDFRTVTYYVGLQQDPVNPGAMISSLYRIESGATRGRLEGGVAPEPQVVVEGVERFDVTFLVVQGDNKTRYLDAGAVNAGVGACAPAVNGVRERKDGCLWRGVQGADVSMLVASNDGARGDEAFRYSPDGPDVQHYAATDVMPNGLRAGKRLRREFRVFAAFRNLSR